MKQIFALLVTVFALFACSAPEYKITGTIDGAADGDSVMLGYSSNGVDFTTVKTAVIENGEFQFSGRQDGCKIYYIGYESEESPIYALFFLEGGEIKAEIGANYSYITGTPANDLNIQIEDSLESYVMKMLNYQDILYRDSTLTEAEKADLDSKNYDAQRAAMAYVQKAVRDNIDNMVGLFLLAQYSDLFDDNELVQLLASIPDENKDPDNNPLYDILLEIQSYRTNPETNSGTTPGTMDEIINSVDDVDNEIAEESNIVE